MRSSLPPTHPHLLHSPPPPTHRVSISSSSSARCGSHFRYPRPANSSSTKAQDSNSSSTTTSRNTRNNPASTPNAHRDTPTPHPQSNTTSRKTPPTSTTNPGQAPASHQPAVTPQGGVASVRTEHRSDVGSGGQVSQGAGMGSLGGEVDSVPPQLQHSWNALQAATAYCCRASKTARAAKQGQVRS